MKATFLKSTYKPGEVEIKSVYTLLDAVKNGEYKKEIEAVRKIKDKEERNKKKINDLSGVSWAGRFTYRENDGLIEGSGLAILDFDHLADAPLFRDSLKQESTVFAAWCSPSGDGVKALVRIPEVSSDEEYKEYYEAILHKFRDASADTKTKDISRLCFNSYDPDLWINESAQVFDQKVVIEKKEANPLPEIPYYYNEVEIFEKLEKWLDGKGEGYYKGNRNMYLFKLAAACNRFGIARTSTQDYFTSNYDLPEKEIIALVHQAYKKTGIHGSARFENRAGFTRAVAKIAGGESKNKIINQLINDGVDSSQVEDIFDKAKKAVEDKMEVFWETVIKNSKTVINSKPMKYVDWLSAAGFYKYYYSKNDYMLVKVNKNIVTEITIDRIRSYVKSFVRSLPYKFDMIDREQLYEFVFVKAEKQYFGNSTIELLESLPINFVKDEKDKAYLYFKNTAIEITKDVIIQSNYENLGGYIWENQIIKREYKEDSKSWQSFEFYKFMHNITGKDDALNSLKSIAGYMLHGFKNPALSVAPILNDCIMSDGINGGTGKGLFVKALGYIKPMITFDAKNWDINKDFAFQRVNLDTDIIFIDDVQKNFDFEKLFSVITEGISVNKKNKPEFYISYEDSPKIIIATNYAVTGEGNSHNRRRIEIEFVKHYHAKHTPADEFGHYFYKDWNEKQWSAFDNLMIHCIQYYMNEGLKQSELENLDIKKLISGTNELFVEWIMDEANFMTHTQYDLKSLYDDYVGFTGYTKTNIGFMGKLLKQYAKYKELPYFSDRYADGNGGKKTVISIGEVKETSTDKQLPF